jgi:hypothetical protein
MTEKTAWAVLPNAKYIDLVMDSLKKNPAVWSAAWDKARGAAGDAAKSAVWDASRSAVWDAARDTAKEAAWTAARDTAWDAARDTAWDAARDAILALIAWDNCGYLLEEKPEDVKMLALLGNQTAVLLYPACLALQNIKELEMV